MPDDASPDPQLGARPLVGPKLPLVGPRRSHRWARLGARLVPGHRVRLVLAGAVLSTLLAIAFFAHPAQRTAPAGTSGATPPPVAEVDGGTPAPATSQSADPTAAPDGSGASAGRPRTTEPRSTPSGSAASTTTDAPAGAAAAASSSTPRSTTGALTAGAATPPADTPAASTTTTAAAPTTTTAVPDPDVPAQPAPGEDFDGGLLPDV